MTTYARKPCLQNQSLIDAINSTATERLALVEGFLYEQSVLMISADPGCGKSTILACAIAQMSAGLPVFGHLHVPTPVFSYYIPFERGAQEIEERFKHMRSAIPMNFANIAVNESFIGYNVTNENHADEMIFNIRKDCEHRGGRPDLIILDPIYAAVSGGLSTDEKASQFVRFSSRLVKEFKCSIWMNHHTVKQSYDAGGKAIMKDDPFYGSQWLKAHCTAAYYMKKDDEIDGVVLMKKKDSHGNLISKIPLSYNPDNYTSYVAGELKESVPAHLRAISFLRLCFRSSKPFTFREFEGAMAGIATSRARALLTEPTISEHLKKHLSEPGKPTKYEVISEP